MFIAITLISIFAITGMVWLLNEILPFKICPVCAGVSGTWILFGILIFSGRLPIADYQLPIAILMGGSVVGLAYQLEKSSPAGNFPVLRKTLFIATGFGSVYELVNFHWLWAGIFIAGLAAVGFLFFRKPKKEFSDNSKAEAIKEKLKNCC